MAQNTPYAQNERPRRRCYERLVVAEHRQLIQRFLVADIDNRVHHHRARRRCARSRMQDRGALLVCHRVLRELSRGGTRLDDLEHIAPPRALLRWPCASFARLFPALESTLGFCSSLHNAPSPRLPCAAVDVAATARPLSHATVAVRLQPRAAATARCRNRAFAAVPGRALRPTQGDRTAHASRCCGDAPLKKQLNYCKAPVCR